MRFVVFLFGLVAISITAAAGVGFILFSMAVTWLQQALGEQGNELISFLNTSPLGFSHSDTGLFLCIAAGYGFLALILALMRCGWQAALMLIVPALGVALLNPYAASFAGFQVFIGLLSFVVGPLPIEKPVAAPKSGKSRDDDDEED